MKIAAQIILFLISAILFAISFLQFNEKGPLLNNAYLFASKHERKTMDKRPHYRQSGVVFGLLGIIFLLTALEVLLETGWIYCIVLAVVLITMIYALVSSIKDVTKNHKR